MHREKKEREREKSEKAEGRGEREGEKERMYPQLTRHSKPTINDRVWERDHKRQTTP